MNKLLFMFFVFSRAAFSADQILEEEEPAGFSYPSSEITEFSDAKKYVGPHGLEEYCYENDGYLTYSFNSLGHGYKFSAHNFEHRECTKKNVMLSNKYGIKLYMLKEKVESLLGLKFNEEKNIVIWHSSVEFANGVKATRQAYAIFTFHEDVLVSLEVFTTEICIT